MSAIFSNEVDSTVVNFPSVQDVNVVSSVEIEIKNDVGNPVPVNGTVNIGTMPEVEIKNDAGNPVPVTLTQTPGTPTVTRVAVSTTVATLAAANSTRTHVIVHNEAGTLFVKLGSAATSTDYTYRLTGNTMLDIDFPQTAVVTAIKGAGNSDVQVTEII